MASRLELMETTTPEAVQRASRPVISFPALELPTEDGEPLETYRHYLQIHILIESLQQHWSDRQDFFVGGNMFVYYSLEQARGVIAELRGEAPSRRHYRGPDFFVVLDVDGSYPRQSWVTWEEGGRYPDVIVELLSTSTRDKDLGSKKQTYERTFKTAEYICHDPFDAGALQGWRLGVDGHYHPLAPDERGWLWSARLQLWLGLWEGQVRKDLALWLRFYDQEGRLVLTYNEAAAAQAQAAVAQAREAKAQAREAEARARQEAEVRQKAEAELERLRAELDRLQGGAG